MSSLLATQRAFAAALHSAAAIPAAAALLRPNALLSARQRLDIYRRSYWARLLDSLQEDFPALRLHLGARAFHRLARTYLTAHPSTSFTLRDLGAGLPAFLAAYPPFPLDLARLEWAHIVAFDGPSLPPLNARHLRRPSARFAPGLQPHITLLNVRYPVDTFRLAVNAGRTRLPTPPPQSLFLAVHRHNHQVHYKRLHPQEFLILDALRAGRPLEQALAIAPGFEHIQSAFTTWSQLGWLTPPSPNRKGSAK